MYSRDLLAGSDGESDSHPLLTRSMTTVVSGSVEHALADISSAIVNQTAAINTGLKLISDRCGHITNALYSLGTVSDKAFDAVDSLVNGLN